MNLRITNKQYQEYQKKGYALLDALGHILVSSICFIAIVEFSIKSCIMINRYIEKQHIINFINQTVIKYDK